MLTKIQFTKQIAQNIKKIRQRAGISQEELADRAELYRTYVGHIEKARSHLVVMCYTSLLKH